MKTLSDVTVRARAVIPFDGGIVVVRERRRGRLHTTVPGGRVKAGESITEALLREVREETGLEVLVGPLLFVAEVRAPVGRQDLNLVFLAEPAGQHPPVDVDVLDLRSEEPVLPPILDQVRAEAGGRWGAEAAWLGNLWDSELAE